MTKQNALLVVIRQPPRRGHWLREALDAAMVGAAFGKTVRLLFMGEGVLALLPDQSQGPEAATPLLPTPETLTMYDIQDVYVPVADLQALKLGADNIIDGVTALDEGQVRSCFAEAANILNF